MFPRRLLPLGLAFALAWLAFALAFDTRGEAAPSSPQPSAPAQAADFDLKDDFGAVGDGTANDGPALQAALNALAASGGGTLFVPEGRYLISTPVAKNFAGLASSVTIRGVASSTTVRNDVPGHELAAGLELVSEFIPAVGSGAFAIDVRDLDSLLFEHISFYGRPGVFPDADVTLLLTDIESATVRHCEFYSVSSLTAGVIYARRTGLGIEQTKFLGCAGSSGIRVPIVENAEWKRVAVSDTVFIDYGLRPEQFNKTSAAVPYSWVSIGQAAPATNTSPRREVVIRNVFLDEGQIFGISVVPHFHTPATPADLVYVSDLRMNVSKLGSSGLYFVYPKRTLIEGSHFGWSDNADSAVNMVGAGTVILDRLECVDHADRIRADAGTGRLTVIDSVYNHLDSLAAVTREITTSAPGEDPVQHVRARFETVLGREPDPSAHFYWSDQILACDGDAACATARRAALEAYLATSPEPDFRIEGAITDDEGHPLAGVTVSLTGSQSATTTTDASGLYLFSGLQTSGVYTVNASKRHYTFDTPKVITTPATDVRADIQATINRHAVRGRLTDLGGAGIGGATVNVTGTEAAAATTDAQGNYTVGGLAAGGSYTVKASSARYTFAPASLAFTDLDGDRTADFTGTPLFHTIRGKLLKPDNTALAGAAVSLSGTQTRSTTTDSQGNFTFADVARGGSYVVTPGPALGYTFTPTSRSFANVTADQDATFQAVATDYKIYGRVTEGGASLAGVTMTLTGSHTAETTTDAAGNYSLTVPANGTYTVKPSKTFYSFSPASAVLVAVTSDRAADFAATLNRHKISGRVRRPNGAGLSHVVLTLSGGQSGTTTTDAQGNYSFANLPAGRTYTVTPARTGYEFSPANRTFTDLGSDQTGDFTVTPLNVTISGRVTEGASALAGATMTLTGAKTATVTTDAAGNYSFAVTSEGDYLVTPSKRHYTFSPRNAGYTNPLANRTADFAATLNRHTISGRVTKADGSALQGATLSLSGSQTATATSDSQGNYSFANLAAGGNYSVTVSRANYSFAQPARSFDDLAANQTANFAGSLLSYKISGRVASGGAGLSGVTLTLTGSQSAATTTDAQGNYSFTLAAEGGYTVTPSRRHYTFAPASASYSSLDGDKTANFEATLNRHAIRGRVTDSTGSAVAAVAVALSGSQTSATTTDAAGDFAFTNLPAGGSYTVTPSKTFHTFAPTSLSFADLDADRTAAFVVAPVTHRLGGRVTEKGSGLAGVTVELTAAHPMLGHQTGLTTTAADGTYSFTVMSGGDYTLTPSKKNYAFDPASASFASVTSDRTADFAATLKTVVEFSAATFSTTEGAGTYTITVTREGDTSGETTVTLTARDGTARQGYDLNTVVGFVTFEPGETTKTVVLFITDDGFVEDPESVTLNIDAGDAAVAGENAEATLTIQDNDGGATVPNPIDDAEFFVRQHYVDFLSREPDDEGLAFWTAPIRRCGTDAGCLASTRQNVSAAFFLSIEFQQTGYLVYRAYKAAYARAPRRVGEFLFDSRLIGDGVIVNAPGWEQKLEHNKMIFFERFVARESFETEYPASLTPAKFVEALNVRAGSPLTDEDFSASVAEFGTDSDSSDTVARARVLRRVAESPDLDARERNPAFVLMQYFGYLKRNPDDPPDNDLTGYNNWLAKLEQFGGDYQRAEMVRAFIESIEYRGRFGR